MGLMEHTHRCAQCGQGFSPTHRKKTAKYCTHRCYTESNRGKAGTNLGRPMKESTKEKLRAHNLKHPSHWKGGRHTLSIGYVKALMHGHPAADKRGYVYEHVLVAESALGRHLEKGECVHHINENRADNGPENLYLFRTRGEHSAYHNLLKCGKGKRIEASNLPTPIQ